MFAIQLGFRELFASSRADWEPLCEHTLRFDDRDDAEDFRRQFASDNGSEVVLIAW